MKIETYLNAMELAASEATMQNAMLGVISPTTHRQHAAFRARILKMDAEKEVVIKRLLKDYAFCYTGYETWKNVAAMREREIAKKNARITELEQVTQHD